jgi:hypothetical protein
MASVYHRQRALGRDYLSDRKASMQKKEAAPNRINPSDPAIAAEWRLGWPPSFQMVPARRFQILT